MDTSLVNFPEDPIRNLDLEAKGRKTAAEACVVTVAIFADLNQWGERFGGDGGRRVNWKRSVLCMALHFHFKGVLVALVHPQKSTVGLLDFWDPTVEMCFELWISQWDIPDLILLSWCHIRRSISLLWLVENDAVGSVSLPRNKIFNMMLPNHCTTSGLIASHLSWRYLRPKESKTVGLSWFAIFLWHFFIEAALIYNYKFALTKWRL